MEKETKQCPHCGEEISAAAKKCHKCGQWLQKKCPACGEWIKAEAKKCRYCGEWQDSEAKSLYEQQTGVATTEQQTPVETTVADSSGGEETADGPGCLYNIEGFALVALYSWYFHWGWVGFIIAFFVFCWLSYIRALRIVFSLIACACWAIFGYAFNGNSIWTGVIVFIVALGLHYNAFIKNE